VLDAPLFSPNNLPGDITILEGKGSIVFVNFAVYDILPFLEKDDDRLFWGVKELKIPLPDKPS
jgi:hypothetical protein